MPGAALAATLVGGARRVDLLAPGDALAASFARASSPGQRRGLVVRGRRRGRDGDRARVVEKLGVIRRGLRRRGQGRGLPGRGPLSASWGSGLPIRPARWHVGPLTALGWHIAFALERLGLSAPGLDPGGDAADPAAARRPDRGAFLVAADHVAGAASRPRPTLARRAATRTASAAGSAARPACWTPDAADRPGGVARRCRWRPPGSASPTSPWSPQHEWHARSTTSSGRAQPLAGRAHLRSAARLGPPVLAASRCARRRATRAGLAASASGSTLDPIDQVSLILKTARPSAGCLRTAPFAANWSPRRARAAGRRGGSRPSPSTIYDPGMSSDELDGGVSRLRRGLDRMGADALRPVGRPCHRRDSLRTRARSR